MNAHDARSSERLRGGRSDRVRFSAGSDSPVSTASSHSRPSASQQPQVRRHHVARPPSRTTSPGTSSVTSTADRLAVAHRERGVAQLGVQRLDRQLGAVLVEEPEPDAQADDQQDDQRAGALTDDERGQRRGHEQDQQRIAQLAHQHRERPRAVAAQRVWPDSRQPYPGLVPREAAHGAIETGEDIIGGQLGG